MTHRGRNRDTGPSHARAADYAHLTNPFTPQKLFSDDRIDAIHRAALDILERLGMRVLLPEARQIYADAGAFVDEETAMVHIGRDIVAAALSSAPKSFVVRGGVPKRDVVIGPGALLFKPGSGCPNVTDLERGRRPGTIAAYEETLKLAQSFDVIHLNGASAEPQDVPVHLRHYATTKAQLLLTDKVPSIYARGTKQSWQNFAMIALARGVSIEDFVDQAWCTTVINTNSPRQIDIPMGQGLIDFAKAGQVLIITPFCLSGAMAPVTVAGAMVLQHAEALAGITLAQLARAGSPVVYGSFLSNVDMKSGAPAMGTPEHFQGTVGSGQLARYLGLPWRSGGGSAANSGDAQAANENQFALWGSILGGANVIIHAAGWLESGLSFSYEKFITDLEVLQSVAELCTPPVQDDAALAMDAIAEVQPGGHFFGAAHTMERYRGAFYAPLNADLSNFGQWSDAGSITATQRATSVWKRVLADFEAPVVRAGLAEALEDYVAHGTEAGGAPPVS